MNSINFDFLECDFSKEGMVQKDKRDQLSKEGSGWVAIHQATGITHCYTLEANYFNGKRMNYLTEKIELETGKTIPETPMTDIRSPFYMDMPVDKFPPFKIEFFEEIGQAFLIGILDFKQINPYSWFPSSKYKNLDGLKAEIAAIFGLKDIPEVKPVDEKTLPLSFLIN